jgi:hypothetical protein
MAYGTSSLHADASRVSVGASGKPTAAIRRPGAPDVWVRSYVAVVRFLTRWHHRHRQRADLRVLIAGGFDFKDIGVTHALASREASNFPWKKWESEWDDVARAHDD